MSHLPPKITHFSQSLNFWKAKNGQSKIQIVKNETFFKHCDATSLPFYKQLYQFSTGFFFCLNIKLLIFTVNRAINSRCMKITEKVSLNIVSEASYVFTFWVDKKFIKKCQKWSIWRIFEELKLAVKQCYQRG